MARIRTIKPEFWTSEDIVECSPTARLLFIGLWNFCDDYGVHPYSLKTIKMSVFPGDSFTLDDIETWMCELIKSALIKTYHIENKRYFIITGWHHQKIDKPSHKYPLPEKFDEQSTNDRQPFYDGSPAEGKGRDVYVDVEVKSGENEPLPKPKQPTKFSPPPLDEVQKYCSERNNHVNPQQFVDFYEAKGWMVGKNKMKDWMAAIRTWEQRSKSETEQSTPWYER